MVYKRSGQVNEDFIEDIIRIGEAAPEPHLQGTETALRARFEADRHSYILAYHNCKIVGYINFFPITKETGEKILDEKGAVDVCPASYNNYDISDVFLASVAVSEEYRDRGIGGKLMEEFFVFVSDKIQRGCKIKRIYSYAYTDSGKWLLEKSGFSEVRRDFAAKARLMRYEFDDFSEAGMYLFAPFFVDDEDFELHKHIKSAENCGNHPFVKTIKEITNSEYKEDFRNDIEVSCLGQDMFVITDEDENPLYDREYELFVASYENFHIALLKFDALGVDPTILLNQISMNKLAKRDADSKEMTHNSIRLTLAEKLGIENHKSIKQVGKIRCMTTLLRKPTDIHLAYMLACESYTESCYPVIHRITAPETLKKAKTNYAQYNSNQIYASEKNVVFVIDDHGDGRLTHECLMIFIMELLMFQLCAVHSAHEEITDALVNCEYSLETVGRVNSRLSHAAKLWDKDNFTYLAAKNIYEAIAREFRIARIKAEHQAAFDTYEKLTLAEAQKRTNSIMNIFTFFAGFTALFSALSIFVPLGVSMAFDESFARAAFHTLWVDVIMLIFSICVMYVIFKKMNPGKEKKKK